MRFLTRSSSFIIEELVKTNPAIFKDLQYLWDGQRNFYTTKQINLKGEEQVFTVNVNFPHGKPGAFMLKIMRVDRVDLSQVKSFYDKNTGDISERVMSIFDLVFRFMCTGSYVGHQRKFYDMATRQSMYKAPFADFVSGFIQSVQMTEFGLALNVHLKTAGLISQSIKSLPQAVECLSNVRDLANRQQLSYYKLKEVNKVLKHLKVFTHHVQKQGKVVKIVYTVDCIVSRTPQDQPLEKGSKTTIASYFKDKYNITTKAFPLVQTAGKKTYIPMELCYLVDPQFLSASKVDRNTQNELLLKSTFPPNVYFDRCKKIVENVSSLKPDLQKAFGLKTICLKPAQLSGRVLPVVGCAGGPKRFFAPGTVPTEWGIFCFDNKVNSNQLSVFAEALIKQARQMGLNFATRPDPLAIVPVNNDAATFSNIFANLNIKKPKCKLMFLGIPTFHDSVPPAEMYNLIKHYCDQKHAIMSCCFKTDNATSLKPGYLENFLLKVNGKLRGQNQIIMPNVIQELPFKLARTMVMGVDVNHPGLSEKVLSSIAAAVGSYDPLFTKYVASIRVQKNERDEMVKQLDEMTEELLKCYHKENKFFPDNIFVFRDGVSEGQFEQVKSKEIPLIRAAVKKVVPGGKAKITFIVTQKRHHARFVLTNPDTSGRRPTYNVPSGTVVDTSIVEPTFDVFYLNSHFSPLGTSKPTKYIRLLDELKLSTDALQKFCFYACHNCTRTNKIISIPTPVRYADLCAYRSKLHLEAQRSQTTSMTTLTQTEEEALVIAQLNVGVKIHEEFRNRLYYC